MLVTAASVGFGNLGDVKPLCRGAKRILKHTIEPNGPAKSEGLSHSKVLEKVASIDRRSIYRRHHVSVHINKPCILADLADILLDLCQHNGSEFFRSLRPELVRPGPGVEIELESPR